ncbi:MAG: nuclear transport factor 2 family protein [Candidatus Sulfotelmatobacter sp.]
MTQSNAASAEAYYKAMNDKDVSAMARRLHPDVRLITPMEDLTGKDAVLEAAKKLLSFIQSVEVQAKFESENQAMLAYNMHFAGPVGLCRAAALITFKDGLIVRNELFFDASPFKQN